MGRSNGRVNRMKIGEGEAYHIFLLYDSVEKNDIRSGAEKKEKKGQAPETCILCLNWGIRKGGGKSVIYLKKSENSGRIRGERGVGDLILEVSVLNKNPRSDTEKKRENFLDLLLWTGLCEHPLRYRVRGKSHLSSERPSGRRESSGKSTLIRYEGEGKKSKPWNHSRTGCGATTEHQRECQTMWCIVE